MKKLSIQEKAKAYDKAVESLRAAFYDDNNRMCEEYRDACKKIIEPIFPELAESEDERIRKELLNTFQEAEDSLYMVLTPNRRKSFIAWLEKQGEQIILPQFTFDDVLALQCCMETVKKVQEDKALYEQLQSLHSRVHDIYHIEKQREQKFTEWNEDDSEMLDWFIHTVEKDLEELRNDTCGHQEIVADLKRDCRKKLDWLKLLKGRVGNFDDGYKVGFSAAKYIQWQLSEDVYKK